MVVFVAWWLQAAVLSAQPAADPVGDALQLDWQAPPQCADVEEVERRVALSIAPGETASRRVDAVATVQHTDDTWTLRLRIATGGGTITPSATAEHCETLVDAAVVHLVMALEPGPPRPQPPPDDREPDAAATPVAAPPVARPPAPPAPPPARVHGLFGGGGGAGFGLVPRVDGWLLLNGAVLIRALRTRVPARWRAEVLVGHALAQTQPLAAGNDAAVRVWAWWVGPRGCWEPIATGRRPLATFSFPLCGGVDLAAVVARGDGVQQSLRATRAWVAFAAGASAQWQPLRRLGVRVGAESFVTALRPSFTLDAGAPVYTVGSAGLRGLLALQVVLP